MKQPASLKSIATGEGPLSQIENVDQIPGRHHRHLQTGLDRRAADMGKKNHIIQAEERFFYFGFPLIDIQARSPDIF